MPSDIGMSEEEQGKVIVKRCFEVKGFTKKLRRKSRTVCK